METQLSNLLVKPNDYKLCSSCHVINWYENEFCHFCEHEKFLEIGYGVQEYYKEEVDFIIEITQSEFDNEVSEEDVWNTLITI